MSDIGILTDICQDLSRSERMKTLP